MSTPPLESTSRLFSIHFSPAAILSIPAWLWHLYLDYLWNPAPDSWVASIASTFRVLAILLIAPFVLLTLLDVTSYVIARTLGVVDSTKASTSDLDKHKDYAHQISESTSTSPLAHPVVRQPEHAQHDNENTAKLCYDHSGMSPLHQHAPSELPAGGSKETSLDQEGGHLKVPDSAVDSSQSLRWSPSAQSASNDLAAHLRQARTSASPGPTAFFFNPSEEHNLALSGATIFSPAASRQNSPPLERRKRTVPLPDHHSPAADVSDDVSNGTSTSDVEPVAAVDLSLNRLADERDGSIMRRRGGHNDNQDKHDQSFEGV